MYLVSILCFFMVFFLSLFGLIWSWPCLTRLTKEYYHRWSHLSKVRHIENQKLIYNTEYSIKPNVQAKLDLNSPQMTLAYLKSSTQPIIQRKTVIFHGDADRVCRDENDRALSDRFCSNSQSSESGKDFSKFLV